MLSSSMKSSSAQLYSKGWTWLLVTAAAVSAVSASTNGAISYNPVSGVGFSSGKLLRFRRDSNRNTPMPTSMVSTSVGPTAMVSTSMRPTSMVSTATASTLMPLLTSTPVPFDSVTNISFSSPPNETAAQQSSTGTSSVPTASPNITLASDSSTKSSTDKSLSLDTSTPQTSPSASTMPTTASSETIASATASKAATQATTTPLSTTTVPYESTTEFIDDREYYTMSYVTDPEESKSYWREIKDEAEGHVYTHDFLVGRTKALQIAIPFNFTYYGHDVNKITVAIGGFIYMSDFLHKYLSVTQYIAPLMADFNSSINNGSVYYAALNDAVVFEWRDVHLHLQAGAGAFTFQVQLYKEDGRIVFAYKDVPLAVEAISEQLHSVKVGIADAYYYDYGFLRTIYEYHNIEVDHKKVKTNTAIIFTHKKTCNLLKNCHSCHDEQLTDFTCFWCAAVGRCSDMRDRGRQEWHRNDCPYDDGVTTKETCTKSSSVTPSKSGASSQNPLNQIATKKPLKKGQTAGIVIAVILLIIIAALVILYVYSYGNPSSIPGQFLIKYRPSELLRKWSDRGNKESTYRVDSQVLSNEAYEG